MQTQLDPSADGNSGPSGSKKLTATPRKLFDLFSEPNSYIENFVMLDTDMTHFVCDHDFKFKMLGGVLCKFCGIGKTKTSLGIKSNLLTYQNYTHSIYHDTLEGANEKLHQSENKKFLEVRGNFTLFVHQIRVAFEFDQKTFHSACQIMDMLFAVENAESITS